MHTGGVESTRNAKAVQSNSLLDTLIFDSKNNQEFFLLKFVICIQNDRFYTEMQHDSKTKLLPEFIFIVRNQNS